jgi:Fic family protein
MNAAINELKTLPISCRLIRNTHGVLLSSGRGERKAPGEFRTSRVYIGGAGLDDAVFIPPAHTEIPDLMQDLESFINNREIKIPHVVSIAIAHYQFETIHPFLDGNGRVGRLLITLFLMEKGVLSTPALYISYFLKKNRIEYYDRMTEVRRTGNYEQWVKFFLQAINESAQDAIETIDRLNELHEKSIALIGAPDRTTQTILKVFRYLETNPIIEIKKTAEALSLSYNAVSRAVAALMEKGILVQTEKQSRTRIFSYSAYLDILRKDT